MKKWIVAVCAVVALAFIGVFAFRGANSDNEVTIDIVGEALPPLTSLEELAKQYTEETGVVVRIHPFEFETALQRTQLDFSSGNAEYDLAMGIFYNHGRYFEAGEITPFDDDKFANLTAGSRPIGDFYPALQDVVMQYDGNLVSYPFSAQTMFLWFRKDLFEDPSERAKFAARYGYEIPIPDESTPLTWAQYYDLAQFFTRGAGEDLAGVTLTDPFYGNALQMKRHPASFYEFTNFAYSFGGGFFDEDGTPRVDADQNVEALRFYLGLREFAPSGYLQATWDDALALMQQGKVAMTIMWSDAPSELENPDSSNVVGKVGYSLVPVSPGVDRKVAVFGGWGFLINADSPIQEEAYKFVQWVNQPEQQLRWAKAGGLPAAASIFQDPEYISIPYMPAQNEALKHLVSWPRQPWAEQFINSGIEQLSLATSDQQSAEAALRALQAEAERLTTAPRGSE